MADVFLSYSSADRELTRGLDAELVAAGYTVYWDDMLLSGERFQDALTAQINAAVAVVVIWTPSSVRSDWVYSEARRGVEQKKVVQARTRDLTIDDLPAPFDAFHCPFLDDTDAVLRAVRRLAEPGDGGDLDARRSSAPLAALPTGTVTLVMAEAEASAQQIRDLGPSWLQLLEQQREVCRSAWRAHRGRELKADSTSFSVVFATADDAVAAALDAQRSLRAVTVPDGAQVGTRMGVHTGSPQRHEDGYVGLDVQKASRLAGAAHAGQVLVSESTALLLGADPDVQLLELQLLDLGEHRFKDVAERIRVFQAGSADLTLDLPADPVPGHSGEPAEAAGTHGRARDRARRAAHDGARGATADRHAHRTGRHGQDPARDRPGRLGGRAVHRRRLPGAAAGRDRGRPHLDRHGPGARDPAGRAHPARVLRLRGRPDDARGPGQPRAGARRGRGGRRPAA